MSVRVKQTWAWLAVAAGVVPLVRPWAGPVAVDDRVAAAGQVEGANSARQAQVARSAGQVQVAVAVSGVAGLAAFEATVVFDPTVVRPGEIELGPFVPAGSEPLRSEDNRAGRLTVGSYNTRGETVSGAGTLAVITFEVLADGDPGFGLDPAGSGVFDTFGLALEGTLTLARPGVIYLPALVRSAGGR